MRTTTCLASAAILLGLCSQGSWASPPAGSEAEKPVRKAVGFTIEDVALVTGRTLKLDPDVVQVDWPAGSRNMRQIHVGLELDTYNVRYRLAGAGAAAQELRVDCIELRSLDEDVPRHWAFWWTEGVDYPRIITGQEGESYLAWTSIAPPVFAPLTKSRDRDTVIRERLDAWVNGVPLTGLVFVHEDALGAEVREPMNASPAVVFDFRSIEKLKGRGWRVTYYGIDRPVVHTVVYDGKLWYRADQ